MIPALPVASYPDPLRDPAAASAALVRAGRGEPTVPRVDAVRPNLRGDPRATGRERPESRDGAPREVRRKAADHDGRDEVLRAPGSTPESRWGATLFLAQHLAQLDDVDAGARSDATADDPPAATRRPAYGGPDPHGFGTAAYRRVGAEPPLYRETPVVFRVSV